MNRYMVVEHNAKTLTTEKGKTKGALPIHDLLRTYHWAELSDSHVLVTADFHEAMFDDIMANEKVAVLPSQYSQRPVLSHLDSLGKPVHKAQLVNVLGVQPTHTLEDVLELATKRLHPTMFRAHR